MAKKKKTSNEVAVRIAVGTAKVTGKVLLTAGWIAAIPAIAAVECAAHLYNDPARTEARRTDARKFAKANLEGLSRKGDEDR